MLENELIANRYRVQSLLGEGGMGKVYQVYDTVRNLDCALKVLSQKLSSEDALLQFKQEFWFMTRLQHPHIVHVYEYGVLDDQTPYFTMEIVPGQELAELGKVGIDQAWKLLIQAAKALGFIHSRRLVHRDIKAENLRVQPDGQLKLMDFGLMEPLGNRSNGQLTGTIAYLPPEVPQRGLITEASDIYSLGVVAFEMLTGVQPFLGMTVLDVVKAHVHSEPPSLRSFDEAIPASLEQIVLKMLAKTPEQRYLNTAELLQDLAEASGLDAGLDSEAEKTSYLSSHVLVARDQELEELKSALISMREARSQSMLIGAPAGVGKSRLIEEFKIHAQLSEIPFAQGICVEQGMSSYDPLIQAFQQLLPLTPPEVLVHLGPILAHLLPRLVEQGFMPRPDFDPRNQKITLFETVVAWLSEIASRRPLVIFVDDLHWADLATLELYNYLIRELENAPVLMLGSFRDDEVMPASPLWQTIEEQLTRFLKILPFSPEQTAELIQKMLRDVVLPTDFIGYFYGATSGNAFFIREMLRYLMEEDLIRQIRGSWLIPENYTEWQLPTSIGDTIRHRLKRLSLAAVELIQRVSVVGKRIELPLLQVLAEDEGLFATLEELVERQFLTRETEAFFFPHDRVRETLYAGLETELRKDIHQQVAEWLEGQGEGASVLAWHFKQGRDRVKAMQYLFEAGDEAPVRMEATQLMHEGLQLLEALVNLPGQAELLESRRRKLAWVSYMIHPFICAETSEKLIQSLQQRQRPLEDQIEFESVKISSYTMTGRNGEALQRARELLRQLKPETVPYALVLFSRLNALLTRGEFRQLITEMEIAASTLKPHLDVLPRQLIWAYAFCCFIREDAIAWLGEPIARDDYADVPRQIGEKYDFLDLIFWSYYPEVVRNSLIGRYHEIKAVSDEVFSLIKKMGRPIQHENRFQICLAYAAIEHGELEEGQHYASKVVELGQRMQNKHQQASGFILQGMIHEQRNHLDDAVTAFAEAVRLSRESETDQLLPGMYRLAGVYLKQKNYQQAAALLSEAYELATGLRLENPYHQIQILRLQARLELAQQGDAESIEAKFKGSVELALETQNPYQTGFSCLAYAKWLAENARFEEAENLLIQARQAFSQIRYRRSERQLQELRGWIRQQKGEQPKQQATVSTLPEISSQGRQLVKPDTALELGYRMVELMQHLNLNLGAAGSAAASGDLRELSERLEKVERVNQFSQLIMKSLDLQLVLHTIMDYVIDIAKADRGLLMLRDEQGELSVQVVRTREGESLPKEQLLKFSKTFTQRVIDSGKSLWVADAQSDQELSQKASIMALDLRTIICVPLRREQDIIGLVYLDRQAINESFSQADLDLVESMATFATISLVNARLHAQIQERNDHLQMLNDLSRAISTTLVFEDLLNKVLEFCLKLTAAEIGYIFISQNIDAEPASLDELSCQASQDKEGRPLEDLQVSRSIIHRVLESKQPLCLVDMNEDAQLASQKSIMALELRSVMCVPIFGRSEQVLGLVYVSSQAVSYTFTERDITLMESIIRQVGLDIENRNLMEIRKKQELMNQELELARNIQSSMLPDYIPDIPSLEIVGFSQPAAAVGGDYYDYFKISDHEFGLAIGDVNGHGVSAGLLMSMAKSCLFVQGKIDPSVLAVMSALNAMIYGGTKERLFMTFVYSIFNLLDNTVTLSSAGHHLPYHYSAPDKAMKPVQVKPTYPLGVREKAKFNEVTIQLAPEDVLVYYTDGINESHSPEGEEFGFERLEQLVLKHAHRSASEIQQVILQAYTDWVGGAEPEDDMTLVVVKARKVLAGPEQVASKLKTGYLTLINR